MGDDLDYLIHKGGEIEIPLEIVDDIITVKTLPVTLTREQREELTHHMEKKLQAEWLWAPPSSVRNHARVS